MTRRAARVKLTAERLHELLRYDPTTGIFTWLEQRGRDLCGSHAGCICSSGHRQIKIDGKSYMAHRLAWLYMTGEWPKEQIDHINMCPDDNRFVNLREATQIQNTANRGILASNTSGFTGVSWNKTKNKWQASIRINRKDKHLGTFDTAEEASEAYKNAALSAHGEFARVA